MPTNRRRRRPDRRGEVTPRLFERLLTGFGFARVRYPSDDVDPQLLAETWREWGEALLRAWVFGCAAAPEVAAVYGEERPFRCGAGTRPWAWWEYDAPELRRVVSGTPHENDGKPYGRFIPGVGHQPASEVKEYRFGLPRHNWATEHVTYESEPAYLDRLGLWLEGEREAWEAREAAKAARVSNTLHP